MRYTKEMFSRPSPELIWSTSNNTIQDALAVRMFDGQNLSNNDVKRLESDLRTPLLDMKEPDGKAVGFFEQGLFTGLAIEATLAVGLLAICAGYAVPALMRRF
jgi:hypothetical protein